MTYEYEKEQVALNKLEQEIRSSAIKTALSHVSRLGSTVSISFKAALDLADKLLLDSVVDRHDGVEQKTEDIVVVKPTLPKNELEMRLTGFHFTPAAGEISAHDFRIECLTGQTVCLFGGHIRSFNIDNDDKIKLQIVDVDGALGLGKNVVLKQYADAYVCALHDGIFTPDGAPGEIPSGLYLRFVYESCGQSSPEIYVNIVMGVRG